jgi:4-amino-4-deoxy-L-arabinose transferase-like glycosyltransferase
LERALGWLTARHLRAVVALVLLALASYLPGLAAIPPVDRDEARFAQATRQMVETGNYVDIRLGEEPRYKKPIGIYWLQAAFVAASGRGAEAPIGVYRLASLLGAVGTVLLCYWAAVGLFDRRAAFIAAAGLALSILLAVEAHLAKTDAVLAAAVTLTMGALARLYLWDRPQPPPLRLPLAAWAGLGVGILVKGPIAPMVAALTVVTLLVADRNAAWLRRLRWPIGVPLMLAIVLPWLLAILAISGGSFLEQSVGADLLGKVGTGQEGHGAPPGTHLVLFWVLFWPASALTLMALPWVWQNRGRPAVRFCLAWIVPSWLVFEAVTTKLPHYPLPTYPAIAALTGAAAAAGGLAAWRRWQRLAAVPPALVAIALAAAGAGGIAWLTGSIPFAATVAALTTLAAAVAAAVAGWWRAPSTAAVLVGAAALLAQAALFGLAGPVVGARTLSPRLAAAVTGQAPCPHPLVASASYAEASLLFLVGTDVRLLDAAGIADFLAADGCRLALVSDDAEAAFARRAAAIGLAPARLASIEGINVGRVRQMNVTVYGHAAGRTP